MDLTERCAQALKDNYGRLGVVSRVPVRRQPTLGEIVETVLDAADYRGAVSLVDEAVGCVVAALNCPAHPWHGSDQARRWLMKAHDLTGGQ